MITRKIINGQEAIDLNVGNNSVTVIKSLGGTVYSLGLNGREILFPDPTDELTNNELFRGRILFPFNDRIPDGKYTFNSKEYQFPLNCDGKDSIHGLIYNRDMTIIGSDSSEVFETITLQTTIGKDDFTGYPFTISISITYKLTDNSFEMEFKINNSGENSAPYALGWHPYFTFGKDIGTAKLTFNGEEYFDVDDNLYYEGNHYPVKGTDLDFCEGQYIKDRELDIAISLKDSGSFKLEDDNTTINMEFDKDLFPNLQLFVPDDRMSIAVEPISAPSDTFNFPETGLKVISPGEQHIGKVKIY